MYERDSFHWRLTKNPKLVIVKQNADLPSGEDLSFVGLFISYEIFVF